MKLQPQTCNFIAALLKGGTVDFLWTFKIFKNTFFYKIRLVAASGASEKLLKSLQNKGEVVFFF